MKLITIAISQSNATASKIHVVGVICASGSAGYVTCIAEAFYRCASGVVVATYHKAKRGRGYLLEAICSVSSCF